MDNIILQQRILWIDWAKVICIFLMVACHAGQKGMILDMTYQFYMPAFFIISGILFRPKGIKNEMVTFGVPVLLYGGINIMYRLGLLFVKSGFDVSTILSQGQIVVIESFKSLLFDSSMSWFQGYWFVATLILLRILMNCRFIREAKTALAVACFIWCCIEHSFVLPDWCMAFKPYHVISSLPFFVTGMLVKEHKLDVLKGSFELKAFGAFAFMVLTLIQGRVDFADYFYGVNYVIAFINALLGSYLLYNVCSYFPCRSYIKTLSTGTFMILGLHGILYGYLIKGMQILTIYSHYAPLLVALIVCMVLYPFIRCSERDFPLLLGKSH